MIPKALKLALRDIELNCSKPEGTKITLLFIFPLPTYLNNESLIIPLCNFYPLFIHLLVCVFFNARVSLGTQGSFFPNKNT